MRAAEAEQISEDSTGGLGQTLRAGRPLVGGLSFYGVSVMCTNPLAHRLPGGFPGSGHEARGRCRPGSLAVVSENCL